MGEYEDYLTHNAKFSDAVKDTPVISVTWCPGCEPDRDPISEVLLVYWCTNHPNPGSIGMDRGADDGLVRGGGYMSGSNPAEGFTNRQGCEVVHRQKSLEVSPEEVVDTAAVYMGDGG
jgi:hypothetical protein